MTKLENAIRRAAAVIGPFDSTFFIVDTGDAWTEMGLSFTRMTNLIKISLLLNAGYFCSNAI